MKYVVTAAILSILSLSACSSGSSGDDQATPLAAQAVSESLASGLWQLESNFQAIAESDGQFYAEYVEITDDNFIFHVTDGISNCYGVISFLITDVFGTVYTVEPEESDDVVETDLTAINLEATESTLFLTSTTAGDVDEGSIVVAPTIEYTRVENISSQDFNSCTF